MTNRSVVSRRTFIVSAVAAGGALAVGFRFAPWFQGFKSTPSIEILNWIVVSPDNTVTIRIAQMEMGQGTMTAMAQLLAEELEVNWSDVRTEFISIARNMSREKVYGRTATAGSEGVSRSEALLRTVGAQIRHMLIQAAAKRMGVPASELVAQNSFVIHQSTTRKLAYGELAAEAAKLAAPDPSGIELKSPQHWKYIGQSVDRVDIPAKTNGSAMFGIDVRLPNMKYAAILSSPVFGGKLESYDAREALAMQGVRKIVAIKGEFVPGMDDGIAVIADSWWQANKAIKTLSVKWAGGNSMVDNEMILDHLRKGLGEAPDAVLREIGDVDTAIESAAQVLEAEYFVPYLEHATMEPINCTALVTEDRFEVWAPTQVPEWAFKRAARVAEHAGAQRHISRNANGRGIWTPTRM